tara:strand:- start:406 stop:1263 length:858 start_codon:yes stop_codon:yes gene_type:complete
MEDGRARRRRARRLKRQQKTRPRENWDVTFAQPVYEREESEAEWEPIPEPELEPEPEEPKNKKNGHPIQSWVNRHVDNVRLGLGILIFIMCALLLNNNLNVRKVYRTSSDSFYDVLVMGKLDADLTRTAREFVITKNDKYKKLYDDYLLVRQGVLPDRRGDKQSYEDRFNKIPTSIIPQSDKDKLNQSLQESDFLALKETDAMNMVEKDNDKAVQLVFGDEYDRQKDKIITPLLAFTDNLQLTIGKIIVSKLHFSYGCVIVLCLANLMLIFLINDRLDLSIRDEE